MLGEFCFLQWKNGPLFAIREVVHHLQFAATPEKLLTVLLAPAYYEDKLTKCGLAELLEDLNSFSVSPLDMSAQVTLDECLPEVKAVFAIAALIVFSKGVPAWRVESENFALPLSSWRVNAGSARILRRFVEGGCDPQFLETEREKLKPRISRAEREPRSRREETHRYGASTAHLLKDYIEYWLRAEDAAFALKPAQMIAFIGTALRYYAIWSCDGDPNGAIRPAIEETAEDLNARLPVLQGVALRLNAGIAKLRGRKGISA